MQSLESWLQRIEQFHPNEIELGLHRVKQVAAKLNLLRPSSKCILIGGTNGKGSCVATLESLALGNNIRVGCYTSPHLIRFNERIKINGNEVKDKLLVEAFQAIEQQRADIALTFFEFTTLAALYCFAQSNLDLLVLEIGLGGRLDAVNIIEPNVSIITTIDRDHEAWLGSDLLGIAEEKAGIYRKNAFNLVGDKKSLQLLVQSSAGQEFEPELAQGYLAEQTIELDLERVISDYQSNPLRLLRQNVECALAAFKALYPNEFNQTKIAGVLANIQLNGRLQLLNQSPLTLLDVGHNQQSAQNLARQLDTFPKTELRIAVCGVMADKAIHGFLASLDPKVDYWIFVDLPVKRAATADELSNIYQTINPNGQSIKVKNVAEGYQLASNKASEDSQILVIGSFITVSEMLHYYQKT